jgi:hypothetical protein
MKSVTKTVIKVNYFDLEEEVFAVFGQRYEFVADQECGNDSDHTFSVDGSVDKYEQAKLEEFRATGRSRYLADALLNDLCRQGRIEPGSYIIHVSW